MQTRRLCLLLAILIGFCSSGVFAVEVTGNAYAPYRFYSNKVRLEAYDNAKKAAWKKYVSSFNAAKRSNYARLEKNFLDNLDAYIAETVIVQEKKDKDNKRYKVSMRVLIDEHAVDAMFADISVVGNQALGLASDFGNIFVARVVTSSKEYDTKRIKIKESESEAKIEEDSVSDGMRSLDAISKKSLSREATGGSKIRKRAQVSYEIDDAIQEDLSGVVSELLSNSGFEPMEYFELTDYGAPYMEDIYSEFSSSSVMGGRLRKEITRAAIEAGWNFLGMGTVDIGAPIEDEATGLIKVSAKVRYKVWMIEDGRARTVASVRPKQVFALAEDELFAGTEAMNKAAQYALDTVVAQLQKKGIR